MVKPAPTRAPARRQFVRGWVNRLLLTVYLAGAVVTYGQVRARLERDAPERAQESGALAAATWPAYWPLRTSLVYFRTGEPR